MNKWIRRIGIGSFLTAAFLFSFLKAYDFMLQRVAPTAAPINKFVPYPYTAAHNQGKWRYQGPNLTEPTRYYSDIDYTFGSHGFFIDFDLDHPPAKEPNEYRIILIGGSGAAGWLAQNNQEMFYSKLQDGLQRAFPETKIRVINLAMGGAITYQNFIALNLWGHPLAPDLILSYAGINEVGIAAQNISNASYKFYNLMGSDSALNVQGQVEPDSVIALRQAWPGIMANSSLGTFIRATKVQDYVGTSRQYYITQYGNEDMTDHEAVLQIGLPFYVHALQSIRRDFPDVPLFIARQAQGPWDDTAAPTRTEYDEFWELAKTQLVNDVIGVYDFQVFFDDYFKVHPDELDILPSMHLTNQGHTLVADKLTELLTPIVAAALPQR